MKIWQAGRLTLVHIDKRHLPWPVERTSYVCVCVCVCLEQRSRTENFSFTFIPGHLADTLACVQLHKCVRYFARVCVYKHVHASFCQKRGWKDEEVSREQTDEQTADDGKGGTELDTRLHERCCSIGLIKTHVLLSNTLMKY